MNIEAKISKTGYFVVTTDDYDINPGRNFNYTDTKPSIHQGITFKLQFENQSCIHDDSCLVIWEWHNTGGALGMLLTYLLLYLSINLYDFYLSLLNTNSLYIRDWMV